MSFCGHCGTQMKPLLFGEYCPNDCDKKPPDPFELPPELLQKPVGFPLFDEWDAAVEEWYNKVFDDTPLLEPGPNTDDATD